MYKKIKLLLFLKLCLSIVLISGMELRERNDKIIEAKAQLCKAIEARDCELVEQLIKQTPCLPFTQDEVGLYPFQRALLKGDACCLEHLVAPFKGTIYKINQGSLGNPLGFAIRLHRPDLVAILLDNGARIDLWDRIDGQTSLSIALRETLNVFWINVGASTNNCFWDEHEKRMNAIIAQLLICLFSGINMQGNVQSLLNIEDQGSNLLHAVSQAFDDSMLILILLKLGLDPNRPDARGNTPLHLAVANNRTQVANTLLDEDRVAINVANNRGITALMMAARNGNIDLIRRLAARGALSQLRDHVGLSVLDYARDPSIYAGILEIFQQVIVPPFTPLALAQSLSATTQNVTQGQLRMPTSIPPQFFSRSMSNT